MSGWHGVEVYGTFIKVTGELEIVGVDRLSDSVNRFGVRRTLVLGSSLSNGTAVAEA